MEKELVLASAPEGDQATRAVVEAYYVEAHSRVHVGMPVAMLRSTCYAYDLPAQSDGVVLEFLVPLGGTVELGAPILHLGPADILPAPCPVDSRMSRAGPRATPLARSIALAHSVDLGAVEGSGTGGHIRAADLQKLLSREASPVPLPVSLPANRQGKAKAAPDMPVSKAIVEPPRSLYGWPPASGRSGAVSGDHRSAPAPECSSEVPREIDVFELDMHPVVRAHPRGRGRAGCFHVDLGAAICVASAALACLGVHRILNSRWTEHGILVYDRVHLAWTMEQAGGRTDVVIPDAAGLSPVGLARAMEQALDARSRAGGAAARTSAPTFAIITCSEGAGWWSPPASSSACGTILALGPAHLCPIVAETAVGAAIAMGERALLSVAYDARYLTFADVGAFMQSVKRRVERWPEIC